VIIAPLKIVFGGLLKFAIGCLILWGAVTWLGAGLAALGVATLACWMAALGLSSSNNQATELQRLRERLTTLEENLNSAHTRVSDDLDRLKEKNYRLSERLENMEPTPLNDEY
jgi:hypothetical protein